MRGIKDWFEARSPVGVTVICLALVAAIAAVDRIAPPEATFVLFYALVVGLAGWGGGKWAGTLIALIGAVAADVDEWINSTGHIRFGILFWNSLTRFGVYLFVAWLTAAMRGLNQSLVHKIRQRTVELENEIGSRRQTEAQLRENVLQFRQLAESINAVFWMSDPQRRRLLYVSPAYARIWGRSCQSLYDSPDSWLDAIHPEDRRRVQTDFLARQMSGRYDEEYRILAPQGQIRWIQDRAFPIRDDSGQVFRIAGIAEDVTDWKLAAEALLDSENRYRSLVETAQDVIFTLAPDGTFTSLNAAFEALMGWPREEWIGRSFTELVVQEDLPLAMAMAEQVARGERTPVFEVRVRTRSGSLIVAQLTGAPQFSDGHVVGVLGISRDVTQRKQAEEAKLQSEERFRLAMDATSDGLWEWNITTGQTYYSPAYFRMLGYVSNAFPNTFRGWLDLIHLDDRERALAANQDCIENRRATFQVEFRMRAKDGDWRWILGRGKAVKRDATGKALLLVGTHEDVTQRKQTEETLQTQARMLDSLVEGVSLVDEQGIIRVTNPRLDAMFGYERGELLGRHASVLNSYAPDENDRIVAETLEQIATRGSYAREFQNRRKDGSLFVSEARLSSLRIGGKLFFVSVQQDITERKRVEDMLQTQGRVLDNMFDGVILLDESAIIRLTNPTLDAMFGYARGELIGQHVAVLNTYTPEENARIAVELVKAVATRGAHVCEFQNRRKDGTRFATEARISSLTIGDRLHYISVQRDITEKKRLESQILEVSDREQARIGQDLHDGLCQRLVSAGFDINRLEQRLASHSLPETKDARQVADVLDDAITEARAIARGLFPVQLEADGLSAALHELATSVNSHAPVNCRAICPGPPLVRDNAVATHLYRIAQEAVNNALKHSHASAIIINLKTVNDLIELTISDDGVGMSNPRPIAGMGLHIMDYRARTIGGTLTVEPGPAGRGTRVYCCAPQQIA